MLSKFIVIENHPQDSRIKINKDGICQTLATNMGTGGGNVPLVMITDESVQESTKGKEQK